MSDPEPPDSHPEASADAPRRLHRVLPETRFSRRIERVVQRLGELTSWLWLALLVVIVANVVLRYALGEGRIELEELQWHLYSVAFLVALAYGYLFDDHIRVDVLYERLSLTTQAWVELYGIVLLLLPFLALVLIYAVPFVIASWQAGEVSQAPGGLPLRWAIKAVLPASFLLLLAATLARLTRVSAWLLGTPRPLPARHEDNDTAAGDEDTGACR